MLDRQPYFPAILAAPILVVAMAAVAATTGTILISGSIPLACSITVQAQTVASSLDLSRSETGLLVANITESCNSRNGYRVAIATANGSTSGLLKGVGGNSDALSYSLSYSGVDVSFAGGSALVTNSPIRTPSAGLIKPVTITYIGNAGLAAGSYTDTITLTITMN